MPAASTMQFVFYVTGQASPEQVQRRHVVRPWDSTLSQTPHEETPQNGHVIGHVPFGVVRCSSSAHHNLLQQVLMLWDHLPLERNV